MFNLPDGIKSHMPFVVSDPERGFRPLEFCCLQINGKWKIHAYRNGEWERINTFMPEDAMECSPSAEYIGGCWNLTFISGGAETKRMFRLYRITDVFGKEPCLAEICPADVGFIYKNVCVWGARSSSFIIETLTKQYEITFKRAEYIYRITYNTTSPDEIIVSMKLQSGELSTMAFNYNARKLYILETENGEAYKACIWKNRCFYCEREQSGCFEDRHIVESRSWKLIPVVSGDYIFYSEESKNIHGEDD